jgi:2-aminoadipate transaminase
MKHDASTFFSQLTVKGPTSFFPPSEIPVTFNFDQGLAAEETFPIDDFRTLAAQVLDEEGGRALEYTALGPNERSAKYEYVQNYASQESRLGNTRLREQIVAWLRDKNHRPDLEPTGVMLALGSIQAISFAVNALLDPGEGAIVEAATFPFAVRFMEMRGANIASVPVDRDGMDVDAVERQIEAFKAEGVRPKLIYTIPTFQLPTGAVMSLERRRRLVELADTHGIVIIEDNVYGDLRYEGEALPTLLSLDRAGLVLQSHSFSKVLAPGIRIGWVAGDPELVAGLTTVRQDLNISQWLSRMMARYLELGKLDDHIRDANVVYKRKRDLAVQTVNEHCAPFVTFDVPEGGFYLWLRLSDAVDWQRARDDAANGGVLCRPGEAFTGDGSGARYLRLAFSHVTDDELRRGIEVLGKAIHASTV